MIKFAALACASAFAVSASVAPMRPAIVATEAAVVPSNPRRKLRKLFGVSTDRYRARGPQASPKRRRNMVTVGRRVRRKHRRAA